MKEQNSIETKRHSLAHVLAAAVTELYPDTKLAIGPSIENGFYYDFDFKNPLVPENLPKIEKKMRELIKKGLVFEKSELSISDAGSKEKKAGQLYKEELIKDLKTAGENKVTYYKMGDFSDLCAGPHVETTKDLAGLGFKVDKLAGAYWRGSEKNKMLTRVYALAFETQEELDEHLNLLEEAKRRDHRKLGQELDLFSFNDAGPGFPFWHPKGMVLKNALVDFWRSEHQKAGYVEISTPIILREELWHKSGHWDNYKDNMYFTEIDDQGYAIKPMNCPGGIQVYKSSLRSYRELPLRMAELGLVHRHELSGVLHGLFRVRAFVQDDAHIYCTDDQVKSEVEGVIKLIEGMYKKLGFTDYHVELSTRPEKSIGSDEMWQKAEETMEAVAKELKLNYRINPGDGAFYGPKFDFHIKDSIGRTWQCATVQLDFSMPERFDLEYVGEDGERKRPVMIHRTVLGSLERFIGILIENYAGVLPIWLAPVQVGVLPISDRHLDYANKVADELSTQGVRVVVDDSSNTIGKKIRNQELGKIPFSIILGDKEQESGNLAVRSIEKGDLGAMKITDFIAIINS
jgi:threonyl-tRNA synthetase